MATSFREEWNASVHISLPSCLPYAKWQLRHLVARSAGFFTVDRSIKAYLKPSSALQRLPVRQCRTHPLLSETVEEFEPVGARIGVVSLSLVAARKPCSGFYPWWWCLNSIMRGRRGAGLRPHAVVAATATATAWGRTTERPGRLVRVGNVRRSATFWQSNVPRLGARTRAPTAAVRDREGKGRGTRCLHVCPPGLAVAGASSSAEPHRVASRSRLLLRRGAFRWFAAGTRGRGPRRSATCPEDAAIRPGQPPAKAKLRSRHRVAFFPLSSCPIKLFRRSKGAPCPLRSSQARPNNHSYTAMA
jgi:hypothetical protein